VSKENLDLILRIERFKVDMASMGYGDIETYQALQEAVDLTRDTDLDDALRHVLDLRMFSRNH
jgi:hypothetical protein